MALHYCRLSASLPKGLELIPGHSPCDAWREMHAGFSSREGMATCVSPWPKESLEMISSHFHLCYPILFMCSIQIGLVGQVFAHVVSLNEIEEIKGGSC